MGRDEMRAADSDRQAVADKLKKALDEGRLDLVEYDERLQKTYAAKTYGDLKGMLDDLPDATLPVHAPTAARPAPAAAAPVPEAIRDRSGQLVRAWLGGFGGVFVLCSVIWLVTSITTGHVLYFWPVWLLIPMALGVISRVGGGEGRRERDRRRGRRDR
jgi:uncharacterized protein DUF1707